MIGERTDIPDLLEWIDLSTLHVHVPTTVIMVCGGKFSEDNRPPKSFRDAFYRFVFNPPFNRLEFLKAEDAILYKPTPVYPNWKAFETDLAQFCQLVMLFCESEGSISELSTFVDIDEIARKLPVLIDEHNYDSQSYITLGLLADFSQRYTNDSIYVLALAGLLYPVDAKPLRVDINDLIAGIDLPVFRARLTSIIPQAVLRHRDPRSFDASRDGHLGKLIIGLIQHYGALTILELSVALSSLNIIIDDVRITQLLECAIFLGWIENARLGYSDYFVAIKETDAIAYALHSGAPTINKSAWRAQIREYWEKNDNQRFNLIADAVLRM